MGFWQTSYNLITSTGVLSPGRGNVFTVGATSPGVGPGSGGLWNLPSTTNFFGNSSGIEGYEFWVLDKYNNIEINNGGLRIVDGDGLKINGLDYVILGYKGGSYKFTFSLEMNQWIMECTSYRIEVEMTLSPGSSNSVYSGIQVRNDHVQVGSDDYSHSYRFRARVIIAEHPSNPTNSYDSYLGTIYSTNEQPFQIVNTRSSIEIPFGATAYPEVSISSSFSDAGVVDDPTSTTLWQPTAFAVSIPNFVYVIEYNTGTYDVFCHVRTPSLDFIGSIIHIDFDFLVSPDDVITFGN